MLGRIRELRASGIAYSLGAVLTVAASFVVIAIPLFGNLGVFLWPQLSIAITVAIGVFLAQKGARHTLSLEKPRATDLLLCALMALLILPSSLYLASLVMLLVELGFGSTMLDPALAGNLDTPWLTILTMCVCPAIFEELLFRGVVFKGLQRNLSIRKAILFSALFFGLFHMDFQRLISQTLLGALCAFAVFRTGSIASGMVIHFVNNAVAVGFSLIAQTSEPMIEEAALSASMLSELGKIATEFNLPMPVIAVAYIVISIAMIAASLALTYLVLRAFIRRTEPLVTRNLAGEGPLSIAELDPFDADAAYLSRKRRAAWAWFIPGFIIIALANLTVAFTLTGAWPWGF